MENKIWFTSDTHFYHDKEFLWKPRGFNSTEEMVEEIIKRWNEVVGVNDIVYHLGDVIMSDTDRGIEAVKRLNGKIHIIRGNHCTDNKVERLLECENVVDVEWANVIKYKKLTFYLSHFPTIARSPEDSDNKQKVYCLYGHTHQKDNFLNNNPYVYHVGMDSHNCTPVSIDMVIEDIRKKKEEIKNA